ncbi:MAG: type II secretion system F family protein [Candidatus Binatia bacterium]
MGIFILAILAFLALSSLFIAVILLAQSLESSPQARMRRRLTVRESAREPLPGLEKSFSYSAVPSFNRFLLDVPAAKKLDLLLDRANLNIGVGLFVLLSLSTAVVAFTVLLTIFNQSLGLALLGAVLTAVGPYLYVSYLARRRMRKFLEQLPDGLDIMAQGLQAGLGLSQAQAYVAREMADPIGTEFAVFMEELNLGRPISEAMKNFNERMGLPEMRLFSTAVNVQREVGGSLAELLNNLADVIRERFRVEREISSLTAQNRMAAWVVCSLPPVLFVGMYTLNPKLMREVSQSNVGWTMWMIALGLEIIGILAFRRLLRLHI